MKHKVKSKKRIVFSLILLPVIVLTVFTLLQPQRTQQFAQQIFTGPPLFGCLQVGEGRTQTCGTRLGKQIGQSFSLHGRPLNGQPVYYGDRLYGSLEYTNVGDLPINIENLTLYAESGITNKIVTFVPGSGRITLNPGESFQTEEASYRFNWGDPRGAWSIGGVLKDTNGQSAEVDDKKENIIVNATCTALRIQELTEKDKSNLKSHCSGNPNSKLCSSKQYCEIFNGKNCTQPNVSQETDRWQCDQYVYLPKPEQDLLEEFCKVYPDTDACKDFCARTLDSSLCPDKYLFIDTYTGKPIKFKHPRAVFVRDPEGLQFKYSKDYPTDKARVHKNMEEVASGAATINNKPEVKSESTIAAIDNFSPLGGVSNPPAQFGTSCGGPCPPPPAAVPAVKARNDALMAKGQPICGVGLKSQIVGGSQICVPAPPPFMPNCFPDMVAAGTCRREICSNDIACDARNNKLFTFECNQGNSVGTDDPVTDSHVPGAGCRKNPPPQRAEPGAGPPAQCGVNGLPPCNLERNELPPDPLKGRLLDPSTCNPDGTAKPPYTACTSLTVPEKAQEGDFGYAKECRSGRRDQNSLDDPSGVPQHACCANSLSLREGCCGQDCGVWSQKAGSDGRIVYRDGAGRVCTDQAAVESQNICTGVDKDGVNRTRENTIPGELRGTGGLTQKAPPGFIPQQPGTENASCDVNTNNCGQGLVCQSIGGRAGVCTPSDPPEPQKIGEGQDAKCGASYQNIAPFWVENQCCANNCQSGKCSHGWNPVGPLTCDAPEQPATPAQPVKGGAGESCNTTDPSTCQSGKCLPSGPSSGTNGACTAPATPVTQETPTADCSLGNDLKRGGAIVGGSLAAGCALGAAVGAPAAGVGAIPGCIGGAFIGGHLGLIGANSDSIDYHNRYCEPK